MVVEWNSLGYGFWQKDIGKITLDGDKCVKANTPDQRREEMLQVYWNIWRLL